MKRIILTIITIIWMGVIFFFSSENYTESKNLSDSFTDKTLVSICKLFKKDCDKEKVINKYGFLIRKLAHFTEYFILGILMFFTFREYGVKSLWIPLIICILYASLDEIHQLFVDGRSGNIKDVLIDSSGSSLAILLFYFFN